MEFNRVRLSGNQACAKGELKVKVCNNLNYQTWSLQNMDMGHKTLFDSRITRYEKRGPGSQVVDVP